MTRNQEHGLDIDLHHAAPFRRILLHDGAATADADIVVEEVETAEALEHGRDQRLALAVVGDVGGMRGGRAAFGFDHRDRALRQR